MPVRVERLPERLDPLDSIALKHRCEFALCRFEACDQALRSFIGPHRLRDGVKRAPKIVSHGKHVARKSGCCIGAGILRILFKAATDVLRFGLGIQDLLTGLFEFGQESTKRIGFRIGLGRRAFRDHFVFSLQFFVIHLCINLDKLCAVKSTMGTMRA